ncbi:MAG: glycosyltransferase family 2 protein [Pedobacter sp.]
MATVSVCIPTYNQCSYVEDSIRSAFNQTLKPMEIIVCDDCSTDDTRLVLEKLKAEIPILKVVYQPINMGISKNVDTCLRMGTGELILRLDSDDKIFPQFIEKVSALLTEYPEAGYGHVAIQEIDQYDKTMSVRRLFRNSVYVDSVEALKAATRGYRVAANIVMFRRLALEELGYMTTTINFAEDYYLSVKIADANYGNVYLDEVLASYRVWTDVGKVRQRRKLDEIKGIYGVFKDALEPAFKDRGWNTAELEERKSDKACAHADCLGWDVYSAAEKKELADLLLQLSSSNRVKAMIWLYGNGFGQVIQFVSKLTGIPRSLAKKLAIGFNRTIKVRNK